MKRTMVLLAIIFSALLMLTILGCGSDNGTNTGEIDKLLREVEVLIQQGEYDAAIEKCNQALDIDPDNAGAYCNRGYAYHDAGQYEQALDDFNCINHELPGQCLRPFGSPACP